MSEGRKTTSATTPYYHPVQPPRVCQRLPRCIQENGCCCCGLPVFDRHPDNGCFHMIVEADYSRRVCETFMDWSSSAGRPVVVPGDSIAPGVANMKGITEENLTLWLLSAATRVKAVYRAAREHPTNALVTAVA